MLRILVISLVVANLLLLGFQSSRPAVRPETRAAPAPVRDTGIPTIHLFSEMMEDQGLMSNNRQCFTLGPFHSSEDRDDVRRRLQEVSTRISGRETEALVEKGYWVFMPPYATLLEANKELLALQALGLKDIGIIYDGEWTNAISLGYFLRQENAQRRKQDLERKGHKPVILIQRQAEPRYWLDYEQTPGSGLIALDMQNRPNDFMQRPVPCPEAEFLESQEADSQDLAQNVPQVQTSAEDDGAAAVQGEDVDTPGNIAEEIATDQAAPGSAQQGDASTAVDNGEKAAEQDAFPATGENGAGGESPRDQDEGTTETKVEAIPERVVGTGPPHAIPDGQTQPDRNENGEEPENNPADGNENPPAVESQQPAVPKEAGTGGDGT